MLVGFAKQGFSKYHNTKALLQFLTTWLPRKHTWLQFRSAVDQFIGDTMRDEFNRFQLSGNAPQVYNGVQPMDISFVNGKKTVQNVFATKGSPFAALNPNQGNTKNNNTTKGGGKNNSNQNSNKNTPSFPPRNNNTPQNNNNNSKGQGKGKGKNTGAQFQAKPKTPQYNAQGSNPSSNNTPKGKGKGKPSGAKKKNPPICGWCGSSKHFSHLCDDKNNPKWEKYFCKVCQCYAKHPEAVCPRKN